MSIPLTRDFLFYYFGEIHAVSNDLIPNSRRDYFGENEALSDFEARVRQDFMKLREMCYDASGIKKNLKTIAKKEEIENKIKQKEPIGYSSKKEQQDLQQQYEDYKKRSEEAQQQLERRIQKIEGSNSALKKILERLAPNVEKSDNVSKLNQPRSKEVVKKLKFRTDSPIYSQYSKAEKKLIGRIYTSISNAIPDDRQRESLIKIIEEDLTR